MNNILEQVYQFSNDTKELMLRLEQEMTEKGELSIESEVAFDYVAQNREYLTAELGNWYLYTEAKLAGLQAEYQPILEKIKADMSELSNRLEFIKKLIQRVLPPSETAQVANEHIYIHYRKSESLQLNDPDAVPIEFCEQILKPKISEIKDRIKKGEHFDFAELKTSWNAQIKHGGVRAEKNAKTRLKKIEGGKKDDEIF